MSIVANRKRLLAALDRLAKLVPTKPHYEVLEGVEIRTDDRKGLVTLRCFNFTQELIIALPNSSEVLEETEFCIKVKQLKDVVRSLRGENVFLNTFNENLIVKDNQNSIKLPLIGEKLPEFDSLVEPQQFSIDRKDLVEALESVTFSASPDETKQVLTGVNLNFDSSDLISFAATDGHKLAYISIGHNQHDPIESLTIPKKTCEELLRTLKKASSSKVLIAFTKEEILFTLSEDATTLRSRLLEGKYPDYASLISESFEYEATINRMELLNVLQVAGKLFDKRNDIPLVVFVPGDKEQVRIEVLDRFREAVIS